MILHKPDVKNFDAVNHLMLGNKLRPQVGRGSVGSRLGVQKTAGLGEVNFVNYEL